MTRFFNFIFLGWRVHTVTSRDVYFRYPGWVTRTEFVPGAKKFLPFVPEFCAEFSNVPPEISGGVPEKQLSRDRARTFRSSDFQLDTLLMGHCCLI
jgi:hypothetical protein